MQFTSDSPDGNGVSPPLGPGLSQSSSGQRTPPRRSRLVERGLAALGSRAPWLARFTRESLRRRHWLLAALDTRRAFSLLRSASGYLLQSERAGGFPMLVKIDISPACTLRCTACVHAEPNDHPVLQRQEFKPRDRMSVEQFTQIIRELRGRTSAVSLYYLGDPFAHPDHDQFAKIASEAGLSVHSSTHFSYKFSDERLRRIVESGLTHLTVCVDGISQHKYERTRVGGKIDLVLDNLRRLCAIRNEMRSAHPMVEVQYLKYAHNVDELDKARQLVADLGADEFSDSWGIIGSFTDTDPGRLRLGKPRAAGALPRCFWPYFGMVIKFNGDVIPCCNFRHGEQYARDGDARPVGNVFREGVAGVWNSPSYRGLRRVVRRPEAYDREPALQGNFCHGCPVLFHTDRTANDTGTYHPTHAPVQQLTVNGKPVVA